MLYRCRTRKKLPTINTDYIKPCDPGYYNNTNDRVYFGKNKTCSECAAGYYQPNSGQTECLPCSAGYHSSKGARKCSANTYKVSYKNNDISGTMASSTYKFDEYKILTKNTIERTGYTFDGWATSASGAKVYNDEHNVINLTKTNDKWWNI